MNKWNHYTCETCGNVTVPRHDGEGVTPFIIGCHASDEVTATIRVRTCHGAAQSCIGDCDQSDSQTPHVIFFRPQNQMEAIAEINKERDESSRAWLFEHYMKGGALMRFP